MGQCINLRLSGPFQTPGLIITHYFHDLKTGEDTYHPPSVTEHHPVSPNFVCDVLQWIFPSSSPFYQYSTYYITRFVVLDPYQYACEYRTSFPTSRIDLRLIRPAVGQLGISGVAVHMYLGLCLYCQIILFYSTITQQEEFLGLKIDCTRHSRCSSHKC